MHLLLLLCRLSVKVEWLILKELLIVNFQFSTLFRDFHYALFWVNFCDRHKVCVCRFLWLFSYPTPFVGKTICPTVLSLLLYQRSVVYIHMVPFLGSLFCSDDLCAYSLPTAHCLDDCRFVVLKLGSSNLFTLWLCSSTSLLI